MSNSPLVSYTKISPNRTSPRNHVIDEVTIHCVVGQASVEGLGNLFAQRSRGASSNYGIGADGRIGMYCEEKDRSWCSSSADNDNRAITIEVASDNFHPYKINDIVYKSLINLLEDICRRNPNIKELKWQGNKALIGQVDKQNMTVHRWFANKSCPGDYLYNLHGQIANEVNARLKPQPKPEPITGELYRVRKSWADSKSQLNAFRNLQSAINDAKANPGYKVYNSKGVQIYPEIQKPVASGFLVKINVSALNYRSGPGIEYPIKGQVIKNEVFTIVEVKNGWGRFKSGAGWINISTKYVIKL